MSARLNLALLALSQGRFGEAHRQAERAAIAAEAADQRGLLGCAGLIMLPHLALANAREDWKVHLHRSKRLLIESGFVDVDVAWTAELAAGLAKERGWIEDAAELHDLAQISCRSLGMKSMDAA